MECGAVKSKISGYVAFDKTYRDKGLPLIGIDSFATNLRSHRAGQQERL